MLGRLLAEPRPGIVVLHVADLAVAAARLERRPTRTAADPADGAGSQDDQWEGRAVEEDRHERCERNGAHDVVPERAPPNPQHRLDHDHQHGGLQPEEQALHQRYRAEQHIDPRERHDGEQAGQDKQRPGKQAAPRAMHEPADIDRELLGFGTGQQVTVVQRLQEAVLADPPLLLDDDAMHHRDLAGRSTERKRRDPRPHAHRLAEGNAVALAHGVAPHRGGAHGRFFPPFPPVLAAVGGQSCPSSVASRHQR